MFLLSLLINLMHPWWIKVLISLKKRLISKLLNGSEWAFLFHASVWLESDLVHVPFVSVRTWQWYIIILKAVIIILFWWKYATNSVIFNLMFHKLFLMNKHIYNQLCWSHKCLKLCWSILDVNDSNSFFFFHVYGVYFLCKDWMCL